ncbi:MAG: lamin tail domain-containing protein [Caldilineaceae bacterium]|nr:lamin tail domain-containing protein [Caldilineaceae bacterium]
MSTRKARFPYYFWALLFLYCLFNLRQLLADPTQPGSGVAAQVIINEVMMTQDQGLADEDGDFGDWIELYNPTDRTVDLTHWSLTDDETQPDKWILPTLQLESGAYLVIFAANKDRRRLKTQAADGEVENLHTNFGLAADGGFLALLPPNTRRHLDGSAITYPAQLRNVSYGRLASTNQEVVYGFFDQPTPGTANSTTPLWQGAVEPVTFSLPHGFYAAPITIALATKTRDAVIRYTLDGSEPTLATGLLYTTPIPVATTTIVRAGAFVPGARPAPLVTQSYLFLDAIRQQPAQPAGFPVTLGTHAISFGGYNAGDPVVVDYAMDPTIVNDPHAGPLLEEGLLALPTLSLVTPLANWDIYAQPRDRGPVMERPVSVEWIDPADAAAGFQINAGLRLQGGAGRYEFMPKHSFRLFFKRDYGAAQLNYQLFTNSPVAEFDTVILRAGVDRSFAGHPPAPDRNLDHRQATYARDEWLRASQLAMSGVGIHGRFVHLYLNGLYWGLYNLVERPDHAFASSYLGGTKEEWFAVNHGGMIEGQADRFNVLIELAQAGGLADASRYATMLEFIDPIQFSDYVIVNWYAGNGDWPNNNWYANVHYPAGKNLFWAWDGEDTWNQGAAINLGVDYEEGRPFPNVIKLVLLALMENSDFRLLFADRLYKHLFNDGALTTAQSAARWLAITDELELAIVAESARWGDARYEPPITQADWQRAREAVRQQMVGNSEKLLELARQAGYYPALDPPHLSQFGGRFAGAVTVALTATQGAIYYTLDGSDPRSVGNGAPGATATLYQAPVRVTTSTLFKARVKVGDEWSALAAAFFPRADQHSLLRITEIMYHPAGDERDEFMEITNLGALPVDLSNAYFAGITFRFPQYTTLPAGASLTLVSNFSKFRDRYPTAEIAGVFAGRLSDRGETITLYNATGQVLTAVTYDDNGAWPLLADGRGYSLELINPWGDPNQPQNWRASMEVDGTPGQVPETMLRGAAGTGR